MSRAGIRFDVDPKGRPVVDVGEDGSPTRRRLFSAVARWGLAPKAGTVSVHAYQQEHGAIWVAIERILRSQEVAVPCYVTRSGDTFTARAEDDGAAIAWFTEDDVLRALRVTP